jgi:ubiquinone/menaquinone biosynthesis C-methylase UbiE
VHSLDLVSTVPGVIACNMAHTPLADASVDVAVFCLALMGTDYGAFLAEAHRVLRAKGWLWIAEVGSWRGLMHGLTLGMACAAARHWMPQGAVLVLA